MIDLTSLLPSERRMHERVMLRTTGRMVDSDISLNVRTIDASVGGLAVVAQANLKQGSIFHINLALPISPVGSTPFDAEVEVMYSIFSNQEDGFKVGLHFTKLEPKSSTAIMDFVESKLTR